MSLVIALRGFESEKLVHRECRKVAPFVGADREGEFAQMGIGLIFLGEQISFSFLEERESIHWGLMSPHLLIQSWRSMKILECIEQIHDETLYACWYAAGRTIHHADKYYVDRLAQQAGGIKNLDVLRDELFSSAPSPDELDSMLTNLRVKGVNVDSRELEEEVKTGRIATSPLIETLVRDAEERGK